MGPDTSSPAAACGHAHRGSALRGGDEEPKDAFEHAISSTKAALAEAIVPGGGLALLLAIDVLVQENGGVD